MPRLIPLLASLATLTACTSAPTTAAGGRVEPALLRFAEQDAVVTAPDTVPAGARFTLAATTFGGGCVRATRPPEVRVAGGVTVVALFHHDTGADSCTDDLLRLEHRVTLQAGGAGQMVVEVHGANRGRETGWTAVPWVVVRTIVVR